MSTLKERTIVLLGPGFDAYLAVASIRQLRKMGQAVLIIGQTAGFVRDMNGITVRPEKSLSEITSWPAGRLLLLPGSKVYLSSLLTDPRVHNLINAILNNQGFILVTENALHLLMDVEENQALPEACYTFQNSELTDTISPELINLLIA